MSFGWRFEVRTTYRLWKEVLAGLINDERAAISRGVGDGFEVEIRELPFYIVPSQTFFGLIRGQMNKFCLGFEYTLWGCDPKYTKWEQTQACIIFLRALRHSFGSSLIQQESLLWKDSWTRPGKYQPRRGEPAQGPSQHEGVGMATAVQRSGIGWFAPKFDWATWTLRPEHAAHTLLENPRMLEHYQRRWAAVRDAKDIYMRL